MRTSRITLTYTQALTPAKREASSEGCQGDFARADSNCRGGMREMKLLSFPLCSHAEKPDFPQLLEKNGGTTRLEVATSEETVWAFGGAE
jgi:hypothetical protein